METIASILSILNGLKLVQDYSYLYPALAYLLIAVAIFAICTTLKQGMQARIAEGDESPWAFVAVGAIFLHTVVGGVLLQAVQATSPHFHPAYSVVILFASATLLVVFSWAERSSKAIVSSLWTLFLSFGILACTVASQISL